MFVLLRQHSFNILYVCVAWYHVGLFSLSVAAIVGVSLSLMLYNNNFLLCYQLRQYHHYHHKSMETSISIVWHFRASFCPLISLGYLHCVHWLFVGWHGLMFIYTITLSLTDVSFIIVITNFCLSTDGWNPALSWLLGVTTV